MPTVLVVDGYSIVIFTHDHLPPHIHVFARGCEAIFNLRCAAGTYGLRENYRFSKRELRAIDAILDQHMDTLCTAWRSFHDYR